MGGHGEDDMDFGDEDDEVLLAGQLAALGIDEDLELSAGEEENEDTAATNDGPARLDNEAPPLNDQHPDQGADINLCPTEPRSPSSFRVTVAADDTNNIFISSPGPRSATAAAGDHSMEDGEVLKLLEKPLQASRDTQRSHGANERHGRTTPRRGNRGRAGGRGRKRNVTIKECARWVCSCLNEPKYYLMCRVIAVIGYNKTKKLLDEVQEIQESGGMSTADGGRKRTAGGVFFTLLKDHMEPATLKELYADERDKEKARRAAKKRKAEVAEAAGVVMTPRNSPRRANSTRMDTDASMFTGLEMGGAKRARTTELSSVALGHSEAWASALP